MQRSGDQRPVRQKRQFPKHSYSSCFWVLSQQSTSFSSSETLSSMEFWKTNQLPFVDTCISTLAFYEASHPDLLALRFAPFRPILQKPGLWSQPGISSAPGISLVLCHFIPFYPFHMIQMFQYQLMVVLRRRNKKAAKQHLSLKQENMLVWISCQILGRLVGSWWFGHISGFRLNFTELYCLPLDPRYRTGRCQAYLSNHTFHSCPSGAHHKCFLFIVSWLFTPSVLLERDSESSAAFYNGGGEGGRGNGI